MSGAGVTMSHSSLRRADNPEVTLRTAEGSDGNSTARPLWLSSFFPFCSTTLPPGITSQSPTFTAAQPLSQLCLGGSPETALQLKDSGASEVQEKACGIKTYM